tara:strand:- start:103802 stop:104449 length:648 start_codon:yes stop_codon:yes gene_type:complete
MSKRQRHGEEKAKSETSTVKQERKLRDRAHLCGVAQLKAMRLRNKSTQTYADKCDELEGIIETVKASAAGAESLGDSLLSLYVLRNSFQRRMDAAKKSGDLGREDHASKRLRNLNQLLDMFISGECSWNNTKNREHTDADLKPVGRFEAQENAILAAIVGAGYHPTELPKSAPGQPGVKAQIRAAVEGGEMPFTLDTFNKAWQRLRKSRAISDTE